MQLSVTRRYRTQRGGATGVLSAVGFGAGLAAGFLIGTLLGAGGPRRVGRMVRAAGRAHSAPERRAVLLARVGAALAADPGLNGESIELLAAGRGSLELRGWVTSRAMRARAQRVADGVAGPEHIINRLLVHGEDDSRVAMVRDDAPRSA